jgi:hypothetical protein
MTERKRRRWVRWLILGGVVAAIVLVILYARCRGGWGMGGGDSSGTGKPRTAAEVPAADAGATRCALRLDAAGLSLDGQPATQDAAVEACRRAGKAEVVVTGDARFGAWEALRAALDAAGVEVAVRGVAPGAAL